jgi:hypothetical protein
MFASHLLTYNAKDQRHGTAATAGTFGYAFYFRVVIDHTSLKKLLTDLIAL